MTTTCHFCGAEGDRQFNAAHYDTSAGAWHPERIHACHDCLDKITFAPRRPSQPKPEPQLAGDWAIAGCLLTSISFEDAKRWAE